MRLNGVANISQAEIEGQNGFLFKIDSLIISKDSSPILPHRCDTIKTSLVMVGSLYLPYILAHKPNLKRFKKNTKSWGRLIREYKTEILFVGRTGTDHKFPGKFCLDTTP